MSPEYETKIFRMFVVVLIYLSTIIMLLIALLAR